MTRPDAALAAGALALALAGCSRSVPDATATAGSRAAPAAPASASASLTPAARCRPEGRSFAIGDAGAAGDLEVGDAQPTPSGIVVGVVRRAALDSRIPRVASLAWLTADAASMRLVDLGPTPGDAPPPRAVWRGQDVLAAAYAVPKASETNRRELGLYAVAPDAGAKRVGTIAQQVDDSLAFDLAPGLVVWDEATSGKDPHGVVRIAEIGPDGHAGAAHDVSAAGGDAEAPRIVAGGAGYLVLWLEGASLAMIAVDGHGAVTGALRRLTPAAARVSAFDVRPLAGAGKPEVLVVARDDGGSLLRVLVEDGGASPSATIPTDGLGPGSPTIVAGQGPRDDNEIAWVGPREETMLLPLDEGGAPAGTASLESALDDARPLVALAGSKILAATPSDPAGQLRLFACRP